VLTALCSSPALAIYMFMSLMVATALVITSSDTCARIACCTLLGPEYAPSHYRYGVIGAPIERGTTLQNDTKQEGYSCK
jgi:hypothetical protein